MAEYYNSREEEKNRVYTVAKLYNQLILALLECAASIRPYHCNELVYFRYWKPEWKISVLLFNENDRSFIDCDDTTCTKRNMMVLKHAAYIQALKFEASVMKASKKDFSLLGLGGQKINRLCI